MDLVQILEFDWQDFIKFWQHLGRLGAPLWGTCTLIQAIILINTDDWRQLIELCMKHYWLNNISLPSIKLALLV